MFRLKPITRWLVEALICGGLLSPLAACHPYGRVPVTTARPELADKSAATKDTQHILNPIPRYGGTALTAAGMPNDATKAYFWAENLGTLVAHETYLRQFPRGAHADRFREQIRERFVPADQEWQEAWLAYSQLEVISGAVYDPQEGLILLGQTGAGRLPPFLYDDVLTALRCTLAGEKIGVTMKRVFDTRFKQPEDPRDAYETSVEFRARHSQNTHLACILFQGDRMLKSLSFGYDIFLGEPVRSSVPGFATVVEMEASMPAKPGEGMSEYGRVWIEVTKVKINTTEANNVAMFADVRMEVRAESPNPPMTRFAKHIEDHYHEYAQEFVIFAEVERIARIVSLAKWFMENYPSVATKLLSESYEEIRIETPQVIDARSSGPRGLIGGVLLTPKNEYQAAPETAAVGSTRLADLPQAVLQARSDRQAVAWSVPVGPQAKDSLIALKIRALPNESPSHKQE